MHPGSSTEVDARIRSPEGPSVDSDSGVGHRPSSCKGRRRLNLVKQVKDTS